MRRPNPHPPAAVSELPCDPFFGATPYVYQPFNNPTKQLRLLHVNRIKGHEIQCDLQTFDIEHLPEYLALSYTWGLPDRTRRIGVDTGYLDIRENLFSFLREFSKETHTYIWIDQICIDQSSIQERGHQVSIMAQVFRKAAYIIMWLGHSNAYIRAVQTFISTSGFSKDVKADSLALLMRDKYFERVWIVQEILLATEVRLFAGHKTWLAWASMIKDAWVSLLYKRCIQHSATTLMTLSEVGYQTRKLGYYIINFDRNQCQNPLDHIYGLLGLVEGQVSIVPDYTTPTHDLFVKVVRHLYAFHADGDAEIGVVITKLCESLEICCPEDGSMRRLYDDAQAHLLEGRLQSDFTLNFDINFGDTKENTIKFDVEFERREESTANKGLLQEAEHMA